MVILAEFPNDEAAASATLTIASGGTARSETHEAFSEDQFRETVAEPSEYDSRGRPSERVPITQGLDLTHVGRRRDDQFHGDGFVDTPVPADSAVCPEGLLVPRGVEEGTAYRLLDGSADDRDTEQLVFVARKR